MKNRLSAPSSFVPTQEHRRFVEFCEACHDSRYIGLCYGHAGVGKTVSARQYSRWDLVESHLHYPAGQEPVSHEIGCCRTLFYTPAVVNSPGRLLDDIRHGSRRLSVLVAEAERPDTEVLNLQLVWQQEDRVELIVIDEADWLKTATLEQVRAIYDKRQIGLVLIGMPGIEKRLSRYPQLYSRVGFVHHYRPLSTAAAQQVMQHHWSRQQLRLEQEEYADDEAKAAIIRITGGNFRLLEQLLSQIGRVLRINERDLVTKEVVEAARESLVIGTV